MSRCNRQSIVFKLIRGGWDDQLYEFDFRYYVPYKEFKLRKSGVYVFKTSDKDSTPFNHEIDSIMVQKGRKMQQFVIRYSSSNKFEPSSIVKIKMFTGREDIEHEIFLARINMTYSQFG